MPRTVSLRALQDTALAIHTLVQTGENSLSQSSIAEAAKLDPSTVATCLRALKTDEVVSYERNFDWRGPGVRFSYSVDLDRAISKGIMSPFIVKVLRGEQRGA